ncbi:hypothetical protein [Spongiactinospora rosea]|uniref:hypothetical protein n=1 Tax=Spongiactinospora rosea TaxID=2248750 RepID=UPI0018F3405A|nr:hypothetical protein [Spongiactinospora rosea]
MFTLLRTPGVGEAMILEKSLFIEKLPDTLATPLVPADLDVYRRPFPTPQSRRPMPAWARMMPLDAEPADVVARVEHYDAWPATSPEVPKLLTAFEPGPGAMTRPEGRDLVRGEHRGPGGLPARPCRPPLPGGPPGRTGRRDQRLGPPPRTGVPRQSNRL